MPWLSGQCWLSVEGVPDAGAPYGRGLFPFAAWAALLASRPICHSRLSTSTFLRGAKCRRRGLQQEGGGRYIVGGHFVLAGSHADILLRSLPPIVHIRKESDKAAMRWSLERMKEELRDPQPGGSLIAQQLAYMMLVQALRLHLAEGRKWRRLALRTGR